MIATNETTIHSAIVTLLVRTGKGRIEAERLWDSTYSVQYHNAKPGTKYTWLIGAYEFEFMKTGRNHAE
jgi:hypothetical protein